MANKLLKIYNVAKPENYTNKKGEDKVKWYTLGTLKVYENDKMFLKLFHMESDLLLFEQKGFTDQDKIKLEENN